jgi:hypothetical protein
MNPAPISLRKLAVWIAAFIAPWSAIGGIVVALSGCASGPMMTGPDAAPSPAVQIAWYVADPVAHPRPPHKTDCNDYAVANAAKLRAEGLSPYFVVARTETGEGHMVVAVDQGGDTLIYDNRLPQPDKPVSWRMLDYRWIEASGDGVRWFRIGSVS